MSFLFALSIFVFIGRAFMTVYDRKEKLQKVLEKLDYRKKKEEVKLDIDLKLLKRKETRQTYFFSSHEHFGFSVAGLGRPVF